MTDLDLKTIPVIREAGHHEGQGFLFSFGAYGDTHVAVIGGHLEDGLEASLEWLDDNAPGLLHTITDADYAAAAKELGIDWNKVDATDDNDLWSRIAQHAETDLTMVGHTTLKNGNCIPSWEWSVRDLGADELERLMARFCPECEGELSEGTCKECDQ